MNSIAERLDAVREQMRQRGLDALIVPRADEYLGEYIPESNERLRWISRFTGSAGVVVVLADAAAIFVDGRYTVQVRQQVSEQLFEFLHLVDEPHARWLGKRLGEGRRVGYDPRMHTLTWQKKTADTLARSGVELAALDENLIDLCWRDRPQPERHPAILLEMRYTGKSSADKRREIGAAIAGQGADAALVFAADSVACC